MVEPPPDPWPLRHLVLRTPRLTLRPSDDESLYDRGLARRCGPRCCCWPYHLGATTARAGAYVDNPTSVTAGMAPAPLPGGKAATQIRLLLEAPQLIRPGWVLEVDCLDGCRELLGAAGCT